MAAASSGHMRMGPLAEELISDNFVVLTCQEELRPMAAASSGDMRMHPLAKGHNGIGSNAGLRPVRKSVKPMPKASSTNLRIDTEEEA